MAHTRKRKKKPIRIDVKKTEDLARKIMLSDVDVWDKHGWEHGGMVKQIVYKKDMKKVMEKLGIKKRSLPNLFFEIFQDANWHTLNNFLEEEGYFKSDQPYAEKETKRDYQEYLSLGGRTWELT